MKPIPTPPPFSPSPCSSRPAHREHDDSLLDEFDDLVVHASCGDERAVDAIAIALGPSLYRAARELVEPGDSAAELLGEFLHAVLDGSAGRFHPKRERALRWMERVLVRLARRRRRGRRARRIEARFSGIGEGGDDERDVDED